MSSTPASDERHRRSSMGSDHNFHVAAMPIITSPEVVNQSGSNSVDPTFIHNQVAQQRNPSLAKSQTSPLSRNLSYRSNTSHDADLSQSGILSALAYSDSKPVTPARGDTNESGPNSTDSFHTGSIKKSNSRSTIKSNGSVRSVHALGTLPLGSLRLHQVAVEEEQKSPLPECLSSGDVIIISGMPNGAFFGFDRISFSIGKDGQFEGLRDVPSGPHFIYGSSTSHVSTRNGFWIMSEKRATGDKGQIFVRRWSNYNETLEDEVSVAETRIQKENVPKIFDTLLSYSLKGQVKDDSDVRQNFALPETPEENQSSSQNDMWYRLTHAIKGDILTSITGERWNKWHVSSTDERRPMKWVPTDRLTEQSIGSASDRSDLMAGKDMVLNFAFPQNGNTFSSDVVGRARTEQAMDSSTHIIAMVDERCKEDEDWIIGELQFCYITGTMLGNLACLEQWAHLIRILFKAFRLSMDKPVLFRKIIEAVHAQFVYDEESVEGSVFDHDEGLYEAIKILLTIFKSRLTEQLLAKRSSLTEEQHEVRKAFEALESWLGRWKWDLRGNYLRSGKIQLEDGEYVDAELDELQAEDERGEFAPIVVQLEEDGREKGLVAW